MLASGRSAAGHSSRCEVDGGRKAREVEQRRPLFSMDVMRPIGMPRGKSPPTPRGDDEVAHLEARALARHELEAHRARGSVPRRGRPCGCAGTHARPPWRRDRSVPARSRGPARTWTTRPTRPSGAMTGVCRLTSSWRPRSTVSDRTHPPHSRAMISPDSVDSGRRSCRARRRRSRAILLAGLVHLQAWNAQALASPQPERGVLAPHRFPVDDRSSRGRGPRDEPSRASVLDGRGDERRGHRRAPEDRPARLHGQKEQAHEGDREQFRPAKFHGAIALGTRPHESREPRATSAQAGIATFFRRSSSSSTLPVPRATHESGSSADRHGQDRLLAQE